MFEARHLFIRQKAKKYRHTIGGGEAVDKEAHLLKRSSVIAFRETSLRSFSRMVLAGKPFFGFELAAIQFVSLTYCFY